MDCLFLVMTPPLPLFHNSEYLFWDGFPTSYHAGLGSENMRLSFYLRLFVIIIIVTNLVYEELLGTQTTSIQQLGGKVGLPRQSVDRIMSGSIHHIKDYVR